MLVDDLLPDFMQAEYERLSRPDHQRAIGGGRKADLAGRDQLLLTIVWLRAIQHMPFSAICLESAIRQ